MDENLQEATPGATPEPSHIAVVPAPETAGPAPTTEQSHLRVVLSPSETRGRWKAFTEYVGSDPSSGIPGIRVDGWIDPDGVKFVRASGPDSATVRVKFEDAFLPPLDLIEYDASARITGAVRRVRRQRRNLKKRGLE